ncbi:MAG: amidohydrolase family protein [Terriglobia bacterium]
MNSLLIKNGKIICPGSGVEAVSDLFLKDGKVHAMGPGLQVTADQRIDATGLIVAPGFLDIHVHLREPGREDEETIESGSNAAAAGGFTSICCMPNTAPINDNPTVTKYICEQASQKAVTRVFPIGAISIGSAGERLAEIGEMVKAGAVGVSDDGKPVMNGQLMRRAMEYSLPFKIPVIEHCEDLHLSAHGSMNEGYYSTVLGVRGISAVPLKMSWQAATSSSRNYSSPSSYRPSLHARHFGVGPSCKAKRDPCHLRSHTASFRADRRRLLWV